MAIDADRAPFIAHAKEIAGVLHDSLNAGSYFVAVSHHDADGISSASIIGSALARAKTRFTVRIVEELREGVLDEISHLHPDVLIFSDIGSGYLELIKAKE